MTTLAVVCPDGVAAGELLNIEHDGATLEVTVPEGCGPGDVRKRAHVEVDERDKVGILVPCLRWGRGRDPRGCAAAPNAGPGGHRARQRQKFT